MPRACDSRSRSILCRGHDCLSGSHREGQWPGQRDSRAAGPCVISWHRRRNATTQLQRGESMGPLHGFPHAVKDLQAVKGIRTTSGSPILKDFVPSADSLMVARLRNAGVIFIGKTNTPEFGLGSHTYNPVYGATRNAYNVTRSAGGSSGGAAVALALRMVPLADGSDYGGSLRNPAGWNNVFGFRTSIGRIPTDARDSWLPSMAVVGPMARTVTDSPCCYPCRRDSMLARRFHWTVTARFSSAAWSRVSGASASPGAAISGVTHPVSLEFSTFAPKPCGPSNPSVVSWRRPYRTLTLMPCGRPSYDFAAGNRGYRCSSTTMIPRSARCSNPKLFSKSRRVSGSRLTRSRPPRLYARSGIKPYVNSLSATTILSCPPRRSSLST